MSSWWRCGRCRSRPTASILELAADQPADELLLYALKEAHDAGFQIALDGFDGDEGNGLLDVADSVKLNIAALDEEAIENAVNVARGRGLHLIADGVQSREAYGFCRGLGFDAFQGQYFAEPVVVHGASAPTYRLRALSMLADERVDLLRAARARDHRGPGPSFKLMKLANSAFFGGRHRVGSVRQALMTLGSVAVRRWATLLVLAGVNDRPSHLLELGLLRARLCELVAARTPGAEPERAFTVGLFSIVDALLGTRMHDAARRPPLRRAHEPRTRRARGPRGPPARRRPRLRARRLRATAPHAGVSLVDIARAYGEALDWTDGALVQLTA